MVELKRDQLGEFTSINAFRAIVVGMTDALGEKATAVALTTAGRMYGKKLAVELGLKGATQNLEDATKKVGDVLGAEGARLCQIERVVQEGDTVKVYTSETLCALGGTEDIPPKCTFTLGVVWGVLTELLNQKLKAVHSESVLRGDAHDLFEFTTVI